jgi:hypothetical protein
MKLTYALLFTLIASATAFGDQTTSSRGYLVQENDGSESYYGWTDKSLNISFSIDFVLNTEMMTQDQYQEMTECMKQKADHAILVTEDYVRGMLTISSVECVEAPGYWKTWRVRPPID